MTSEWEALVVGINRYPQMTTLQDLTVAAKDAEDIAVHLREDGYQPFRVQRLPQQLDGKGDAQIHPTGLVKLQELQEALTNLLNPPPPNEPPETALFFFSGHGWHQNVDGKDEVFLATSDVFPQMGEYGLALSWLGEQLQQSRVKQVIVWLDCCFSGELMKFVPTNKDFCLITATRSYEPGLEISNEQGLLTKTLLAGLNPGNFPRWFRYQSPVRRLYRQADGANLSAPVNSEFRQGNSADNKIGKKTVTPYLSLSFFVLLYPEARGCTGILWTECFNPKTDYPS